LELTGTEAFFQLTDDPNYRNSSRALPEHDRCLVPILGISRHLDVTRRPASTLVTDEYLHMVGFDLLVFHHRGFSLLVYADFMSRKMALSEASWKTRDRAEKPFE
jgi:hypothetical protein